MQVARLAVLLSVLILLAAGAAAPGQQPASRPGAEEAPAPVKTDDTPSATPSEGAPASTGTAGPQTGQKGKGRGIFDQWFLFVLLGGVFLLWFWMGRGRKKEQRKRREMLAALKKGDKVTSIGGVIGTVVDLREDEVTVKVDESANVRMKFARWAIRGIGDEAKAERPEDAEKKQQR